jgi:restriction system protein
VSYRELFGFAAKAPALPRAPSAVPWKLDTTQWSPELLKRLEWRRLEEVCVAYFEALGFTTRVARTGADGGVDIGLVAAGDEKASVLVQCKAWDAYGIGIKRLLALSAAMTAAGVGEGMLVTAGRFTPEAKTFAAKHNIRLVDGAALLARFAELEAEKALTLLRFATEGDFLTPTCPACAVKMISRQSTQGGRKFWGCRNYPRCKQTIAPTSYAPA